MWNIFPSELQPVTYTVSILVWYDTLPTGIWWDYAVKHIPNLLLVYREAPQMIFGCRINFAEHKSDVARLEAVLVLGKPFR